MHVLLTIAAIASPSIADTLAAHSLACIVAQALQLPYVQTMGDTGCLCLVV